MDADLLQYNPIAQQMEDSIPDDCTTIAIKYNLSADEIALLETNPDSSAGFTQVNYARQYLEDSGVIIIASSVGLHLKGKSQHPHIHYHVIGQNIKKPSSASQHRQRWLDKKVNQGKDFGDISFMYKPLDVKQAKYGFLSYPFKEGIAPTWARTSNEFLTINQRKMEKTEFKFLKDVGTAIYEKQCGLRLRQDKCEERKQLALLTLYVLCDERKTEFSSYESMVKWLDVNYIDKLKEIGDFPDPQNYKTNTQKVCVKLGYLKYSTLCLGAFKF